MLAPRPPRPRAAPCSFVQPTAAESRRSSGRLQILLVSGGAGSFSSGRPDGSAWTEPGKSSRGSPARRLRFSPPSLLPLISHSFVLSLGLRAALVWWRVARSRGLRRGSCGRGAPGFGCGDLVRDHVVLVGLLEARIRACRRARLLGCWLGRGFGRRGRVSWHHAFAWHFRSGLAPILCCFVSTESKLLCGLRLDLVGRGWCVT